MGPDYAFEISAYLVNYNSSYGPFSALYSVLDGLCCGYYFMRIFNDFGNVLNMKVLYNLLN